MAQLNSPGVDVTVVDESFYTPAAAGTVPLIFVATEENKQNSSGTGIAEGTLASNAGKMYLMTSQRDIIETFGTPVFKVDANNNPVHAGEQNEYGLQAAYSFLGVSNRAFIVRANVDLKQLGASPTPPAGDPEEGDWWFDINNTKFGIFEWDASSVLTGGQKFNVKTPLVITDITKVEQGTLAPKAGVGSVGSYVIVAVTTLNKLWFKKPRTATDPKWVEVGGEEWTASRPTAKGTKTVFAATTVTGTAFSIKAAGELAATTFTSSEDTAEKLITAINDYGSSNSNGISAAIINGRVEIYSTGAAITFSGTGWNDKFGIANKTYYCPVLAVSKHTDVPEWKAVNVEPRPTGSVWVKTTTPNLGANWAIKTYNSSTGTWVERSAPLYKDNGTALAELNSTGGGLNLARNTVYVKYNDDEVLPTMANFKIYIRKTTGATTVVSGPLSTAGTYKFKLRESVAGSAELLPSKSETDVVTVVFADDDTALNADLLTTAINNASSTLGRGYENITASIGTGNRVVLSHVLGGEISIVDVSTGAEKAFTTLFEAISSNNLYAKPINLLGVAAESTNTSNEITLDDVTDIEVGMTLAVTQGTSTALNGAKITNISGSASPYTLTLDKVADTSESIVATVSGTIYTATLWTSVTNQGVGFIPASGTPPSTITADGQMWYDSDVDDVDILINTGTKWVGYQFPGESIDDPNNPGNTITINVSPYYNSDEDLRTDPNGPIVTALAPSEQSDGTDLVNGDIWVSTADIENYPRIYVYNIDGDTGKWIEVDKTDQTTENGIVFADARWTAIGAFASDAESNISELLTSAYVDFDAPDPRLYPKGMLLWNLRRSGFNVKKFVRNYIDVTAFNTRVDIDQGELQTNYYPHRWVSLAANQENGAGSFGRHAQRRVVIQALQSEVNTNQDIRDEEGRVFNLIACPGYSELVSEMVSLNYDRRLTAFVVGDSPARLKPDATTLLNWGNNQANATEDGDQGLVTFDEYLAFFYPWGLSSDNLGNNIAVPPSHMMLRTIALSDNVSYPWFAPAGTRRGGITNASSIGYVDSEGEFRTIFINTGTRDTLASIKVNPIMFISQSGLVNFAQYTRARNASALDRINVARLIAYLRRQLTVLARPYVFEPNDKITRDEFKGAIDGLMLGLLGQRALYDFIVVCDQTNNTPARIDRQELWADVAIEPVKAAEFIYIPLRIKNTGEIAGGNR